VLPDEGSARVTVCDATGRRVRTLLDGAQSAGPHVVHWDGTSDNGTPAPAGVYFVRARWKDQVVAVRVARLR